MLRKLFVSLVVLLTLAPIAVPSCVFAEIMDDNKNILRPLWTICC